MKEFAFIIIVAGFVAGVLLSAMTYEMQNASTDAKFSEIKQFGTVAVFDVQMRTLRVGPPSDYRSIYTDHLFRPDRGLPRPVVTEEKPPYIGDIKIEGVIVSGGGRGIANIMDRGTVKGFRQGSRVRGWVLLEIKEDGIILKWVDSRGKEYIQEIGVGK